MKNKILQDSIFIQIDTECEKWRKSLHYEQVLEGSRKSGFHCIKCKNDITPKISATIGVPPSVWIYGMAIVPREEQLLMTEKELRIVMNAFYDNVK